MNAATEVSCSPGNGDRRVRIRRQRPLAAQGKPLQGKGIKRVATKKRCSYTAVKAGGGFICGSVQIMLAVTGDHEGDNLITFA